MTTARIDAHRPAEMIPTNYVYLASSFGYKAYREDGSSMTQINWDGVEAWEAVGKPTKSSCDHAIPGQCDHCGAYHIYQTILQYTPTGEILSVGHTCAIERFGNPKFKHVIASAARRAELNAVRNSRTEKGLAAMSPEVRTAYDWALTLSALPIAADIASKVAQYGPLSVKQEAFLVRLFIESQEPVVVAKVKPVTSCPAGRVIIQGQVKAIKYQSNAYGGIMKMLVESTEGYKVWGKIPTNISDAQQGDTVKFSAIVEASASDPAFGFFTWPNHSVIVLPAAPQ